MEFFRYSIMNILYQRAIYSPYDFAKENKYGRTLYVVKERDIKEYLDNILSQVQGRLPYVHRYILENIIKF